MHANPPCPWSACAVIIRHGSNPSGAIHTPIHAPIHFQPFSRSSGKQSTSLYADMPPKQSSFGGYLQQFAASTQSCRDARHRYEITTSTPVQYVHALYEVLQLRVPSCHLSSACQHMKNSTQPHQSQRPRNPPNCSLQTQGRKRCFQITCLACVGTIDTIRQATCFN